MGIWGPPPFTKTSTAVCQSETNDSLQLGQVGPYSKHSTSSGGWCTTGFPIFFGGGGIGDTGGGGEMPPVFKTHKAQ